MVEKETPLADIISVDKQLKYPNSKIPSSEETKSKHDIRNHEEFIEGRAILGQIITTEMETTGGTDLDWVIEHKGGFVIFEFKKFSKESNTISIPIAQMIVYERLYEQLKKRHVFVIGYYKNTNFRMIDEPLWFFEISNWKNKSDPIKYEIVEFSTGSSKKQRNYLIKRDDMKQIDVKTLQKKMDEAWKEFELEVQSR